MISDMLYAQHTGRRVSSGHSYCVTPARWLHPED